MDSVLRIVQVYTVERVIDCETRKVLVDEEIENDDDGGYTVVDLYEDGTVDGGYDYVDSYEEAKAMKEEILKERKEK